eukprot:s3_g12.t1
MRRKEGPWLPLWLSFCSFHGFAGPSACWHGEYDELRCCVQGDPACWDELYTREKCCGGEFGNETRVVRGDPACWIDGYSFEECCLEDPKEGCWDDNFVPERCCVDKVEDLNDHSVNVLERAFMDAFHTSVSRAAGDSLDCHGPNANFWNSVKVASASINISHTYGQTGSYVSSELAEALVQRTLAWRDIPGQWDRDKNLCPEGAIAAIDLVIGILDEDHGRDTAVQVYQKRLDLAAVRPHGAHAEAVPWRTQDLAIEHVPRLLGLEDRHRCHGSNIKIFIYRLPQFAHMLKPLLRCAQKMPQCTASVHIHRWLESGSCLTEDPDSADLFFLPAYEACYNETACAEADDTERCWPNDFDPLSLPYFARRGGQDHMFLFACNLLPFMDSIMIRARNSIMVTVESFQAANFAGPNMLAWLVHSKDVLIPGYIPKWRLTAMLAFNRPMMQRNILAIFHGHTRSSPSVGHMYQRSPLAETRDRVVEFFGKDSMSSAGPPVKDYFRRSGLSRFCLIPAGLTAWTIHLYESFFFGCIPVLLSDEVSVPFQDEIDWPRLSFKVPSSIDMAELHARLRSVRFGQLKSMYRELAAARCWFDYSRGWGAEGHSEEGCSPYLGLIRGLARRAEALRRGLYQLPLYWEPPEPET